MDPVVLTVYKSPFPKIRLGKEYDGGYVIVDIPNPRYSLLLAGGINDDISFEEDFYKRYKCRCIAFDGTIDALPGNSNIEFVKKNIGFENNDNITNLNDIIYENQRIFIKMDIEGGEIPWIKTLSEKQMDKFEQIVMEFHFPFSEKEVDVFNKINISHARVHFHGNNAGGLTYHRGVVMPNVFECTYIHKKYFSKLELSTELIPSPIDMQNVLDNSEIHINYPPFVN
jgi:hypothetical protein